MDNQVITGIAQMIYNRSVDVLFQIVIVAVDAFVGDNLAVIADLALFDSRLQFTLVNVFSFRCWKFVDDVAKF